MRDVCDVCDERAGEAGVLGRPIKFIDLVCGGDGDDDGGGGGGGGVDVVIISLSSTNIIQHVLHRDTLRDVQRAQLERQNSTLGNVVIGIDCGRMVTRKCVCVCVCVSYFCCVRGASLRRLAVFSSQHIKAKCIRMVRLFFSTAYSNSTKTLPLSPAAAANSVHSCA